MNWNQLKTIFWLRWRLMCNQSRRSHGLGIVVSILMGLAAGVLAAVFLAGAFFGGLFGLRDASPNVIWIVWAAVTLMFIFFWLVGLITELQRSETIDLQKLMHLPVALGQMFVINFLVSHFTLSVILFAPAMLGLALGLVLSRGIEMSLLIPLAAGMIFMISAWTYCLRGWLAVLMTNPRRRRTVIVCLTFSLILIGQAPNLYFNVFHHFNPRYHGSGQSAKGMERQSFNRLLAAQKFVPPLWLPWGARALALHNPAPALLGTLGCFALGALGLRRAYRSTVRFYHGEIGGQSAVKIKVAGGQKIVAPRNGKVNLLERRLPYVPEQAAALALATFRSLLRAPEVKMAWAFPFIMVVIAAGTVFSRKSFHLPAEAKPFAATGAAAFSILMLIQFFTNQFGFDRDGFRSLILSPADRRCILLGKNLACAPAGLIPGALLLALLSVSLRLPPLTIIATLLQLMTLLLIVGLGGNFVSIIAPQRIAPGTLRPSKTKIEIMLLMLVLQLLFIIAMSPVFLPPLSEWLLRRDGLPGFVPVNLILSAMLCAAMMILYWQSLGPLARLLQKRETKILESVTVEVE